MRSRVYRWPSERNHTSVALRCPSEHIVLSYAEEAEPGGSPLRSRKTYQSSITLRGHRSRGLRPRPEAYG